MGDIGLQSDGTEDFYQAAAWGIKVQTVLTDNGGEFCGREGHPYELYCALTDIEHRTTQGSRPQTNGFVERFIRTVKQEFIGVAFMKRISTSIEELQEELDRWLNHYNYERPHRGYRNMGKRPFETVEGFVKSDSQ